VKPTELIDLLRTFYQEKASMRIRHVAGARHVVDYNFNNTYQYVINRDDVQLSWLSNAILALGGTEPAPAERPAETASEHVSAHAMFERDAQAAQALVERWRPRVEAMSNARNRKMLEVILGETAEQQRFFEQAMAGRTDLLGRRGDPSGPARGAVMGDRWIE